MSTGNLHNAMRSLTAATLIALSAVTLSCTKTQIEPETPKGPAIEFSTKDPWTKASDEAALSALKETGFQVWGWFEGTTSGHIFHSEGKTDDGTHVTHVDGNWTYSPAKYWMNGLYDFAAVYPATVACTYTTAQPGEDPTLTIPDFDVTNQDDLLVAFKTGIDGKTPPSTVGLNFKHALTKVNIKVSQNTAEDASNQYKVTNVRISGIKNLGYISASNSVTKSNWKFDKVSLISFEQTFSEPVLLSNGTNNGVATLDVWGDDDLLLIPQDIDNQAMQILIEFDYIRGEYTYKRSVNGYIPEGNLWNSGLEITYEFLISQEDNITFLTPTIKQWEDSQTGAPIIIK